MTGMSASCQRRRNLKGDRPISVNRLPDEASTRSQQRGGFKGEGYRVKTSQSSPLSSVDNTAPFFKSIFIKRTLVSCSC
ncbi:hypothetical protein [Candidatus Regiella insecticola]|uniref:hypothetical protein n=1 Tax=Candidatus Regiella insecticola TaxID=138073 RepID=UPI0021A85E4E|nr:hypothetical protein [Candidatus Regiella insecticola]